MENTKFELLDYLNHGVRLITGDLARSAVKYPRTLAFLAEFSRAAKAAEKTRASFEADGHHIPPFLLGSITDACNLHCKGCYAHAAAECRQEAGAGTGDGSSTSNGSSTGDGNATGAGKSVPATVLELLPASEWDRIFKQAEDLGISFFILAGGEPYLRQDVLEMAGQHKKILFPVITNGMLIGSTQIRFLKANRNMLPVLSIEGDQAATDERRGDGVAALLSKAMDELQKAGILFGTSITVTKANLDQVLSDAFIESLASKGCRGILYIEYVPAQAGTDDLVPDDADRQVLMDRLSVLREEHKDMIFIAFPGDEQAAHGCLAAGRGFFHINPYGGAEPCPFSPYSDVALRNTTLLEALESPLFRALTDSELLALPHTGGCTLFQYDDQVQALLQDLQKG